MTALTGRTFLVCLGCSSDGDAASELSGYLVFRKRKKSEQKNLH